MVPNRVKTPERTKSKQKVRQERARVRSFAVCRLIAILIPSADLLQLAGAQ
jgi:hypothetical protein